MDTRLKHRLVGTAVIVALAVIFLPELLRPSAEREPRVEEMELPPKPVHTFESTLGEPTVETPPPDTAPEPMVIPEPAGPTVEAPEPVDDALPSVAEDPSPELEESAGPEMVVEPEQTPTQEATPTEDRQDADSRSPGLPEVSPDLQAWIVQVGSFSQERNAETLRDRLQAAGFTAFVETARVGGRQMYRVRVGPELEKRNAERLKREIQEKLQIAGQLLRYP